MGSKTVTVELSEELVALFEPEADLAGKLRESFVLALLRNGRISQGKVARPLGITRTDILDEMSRHRMSSGPETAEEMREEIQVARRYLHTRPSNGGNQQQ